MFFFAILFSAIFPQRIVIPSRKYLPVDNTTFVKLSAASRTDVITLSVPNKSELVAAFLPAEYTFCVYVVLRRLAKLSIRATLGKQFRRWFGQNVAQIKITNSQILLCLCSPSNRRYVTCVHVNPLLIVINLEP